MAGIEDYLEQIQSAIYGKDVRQAIHDGIEECYKDGKAGAIDLVARQEIAELIAPSGEAPSAAEVTDARVGATAFGATSYQNLGTAIRTQVDALSDNISEKAKGISNILETLFFDSDETMTFTQGTRGASQGNSVAVSSSPIWVCSSLVPVAQNDIFTVVNMMPDKFKFAVRGYTENEANNGVMIATSCQVLDSTLAFSGSYSTVYSNTISAVIDNTFEICKSHQATIKYLSIHVRPISNANIKASDISEIQSAFRLYRTSPSLGKDFVSNATIKAMGINIQESNKASICNGDFNDIPLNTIYGIQGGVALDNAPPYAISGGLVITVAQRLRIFPAGSASSQIVLDRAGKIYSRTYWGLEWNEWVSYGSGEFKGNILVVGDSIARGGRNESRGFVGDIGVPFINMAVGSATVSNIYSTYTDSIHKFTDADNIPNQLTSYYEASDEAIQTAFGITKFIPDAIIAEGGINDYFKNGVMGNIPTAPVSSDTEANALDRSTLMGGLQYLFYNMVKLYHKAQRFFVITHKTYRVSKGEYCPVVANTAGYTQEELHDAIVQCCKVYGVKVIDVYDESMLNTKFSEYRTQAESWRDAQADDYCDCDGIHPLAYGYKQAYVPLVKNALGIGTEK